MLTRLHIELLAQARLEFEQAKAELDAERKAFDERNAHLISKVESYRKELELRDNSLRDAVLDSFKIDENPKPHDGIEIKQVDSATFDKVAAHQWAISNAAALLTLDVKAYDKLLREVRGNKTLTAVFGSMPGEVVKEPKVYIAGDLSAYLPKKEEPK
jgi:hypothetical protein